MTGRSLGEGSYLYTERATDYTVEVTDGRTLQEVYHDRKRILASSLLAVHLGDNAQLMGPGFIDEFNPDLQKKYLSEAQERLSSRGIHDPTLRIIPGEGSLVDDGEFRAEQQVAGA